MRIDIITVLPEMLEGFFNCSIMSRAQKKGIAEIHIHNLRDYAYDRYRKVDDYPFGGFAGMVMKIEPIDRCISALKAEREYDEIIFTSPDGEQFNQPMANSLSLAKNLIILCGHFKGLYHSVVQFLGWYFCRNLCVIVLRIVAVSYTHLRIEQMVWMLFLKVYDAKEDDWELNEDNYESIIPEDLRWRNWAKACLLYTSRCV